METVDYQAVLTDLKMRRARLDAVIAAIESIIGEADVTPDQIPEKGDSAGLSPSVHPDTFFGLSIAEAAKKYLKMARRAQHISAIAEAIGQGGLKKPSENVLSSILVRAAKGREVAKVGKGMWGLAEWYPKRPKGDAT